MINAANITKSFGSNHVLRGVSLRVETGEVVSIIGSSGSGKSTFLRTLNFLETADGGSILEYGTPSELFDHTREERTRQFIQSVL